MHPKTFGTLTHPNGPECFFFKFETIFFAMTRYSLNDVQARARHDDGHICKLKKLTLIGWHILLDIKMTTLMRSQPYVKCKRRGQSTLKKKEPLLLLLTSSTRGGSSQSIQKFCEWPICNNIFGIGWYRYIISWSKWWLDKQ